MRIHGVLESCLYAADLQAAEQFYETVLRLEKLSHEPGRHVFFRCGNGVVLIFNPSRTSTDQTTVGGASIPLHGSHGPGHLAFSVADEDVTEWREHLSNNNVEIESEVSWPNGGESIYLRDPAGNSIELASARIWGLADE